MTVALFAVALTGLLATAGRLHILLQMLQQEHYENARLYRWVRQDRKRHRLLTATAVLGAGALSAVLGTFNETLSAVTAILSAMLGALWLGRIWTRQQIKPLVFTSRARRIYSVALVLVGVVLAAALLISGSHPLLVGLVGAAACLAGPVILGLANRLLSPYQRLENERYLRAARAKLETVRPLVVGISGSFGKTTTKACMAAALEPCGPVYPTPASFNSKLGIARAINEGLEKRHTTFVAELGAYRIGDIAELCELVRPTLGVLTSLGPAHLERFGSMDAIERAEGEVADALPADGLFVTSADDARCRRVARERASCPVRLFSVAAHPEADVWAENVEVAAGGTKFDLRRRDSLDVVPVRTRLLGAHNVANVLAAAAVAQHLGVTDSQLARSLRKVRPPKHRLEPISNEAANVVVIDDSYNSNPVGAAAALDVLKAHEAERRILVTPGMVELGEQEAEENRRFGQRAAGVCDLVVLSGPLSTLVEAGLLESGFDAHRIIRAADGPGAHAAVAQMSQPGDVFLFENDLPDVYG